MSKELFEERAKEYFGEDCERFLEKMDEPLSQGFFLNTLKGDREEILEMCDFRYRSSSLSADSFYHDEANIGKTKAYELGLIYPQDLAASLTTKQIDKDNVKTVVDLCAAPGGKSINVMNRLDSGALLIANDNSYARANTLCFNLERMGIDNAIVTSKNCDVLADELESFADLVILDAPCSGEGMVRKYPEILDDYSLRGIETLAETQKGLLEDAYRILKGNGQLVYSTCTYAFEEDENQIASFLERHKDMHLFKIEEGYASRLEGTVKMSFLNDTEGQFFAIMRKDGGDSFQKPQLLKPIRDRLAEDFIRENLDIGDYYLYRNGGHYHLSLTELYDLKDNVLRYGIYLGDAVGNRFEPSHALYRANSLRGHYRHVYDLDEEEYGKFISGNELQIKKDNGYYLLTYRNYPLGYGKCANGRLKNKYPKGLRRVL